MSSLRNQRIQHQLQTLKTLPNISLSFCQSDQISRIDKWIIFIIGLPSTIHQQSIYPITITFPQKYPILPPIISFPQQFLHIHVYPGGLICLPLIQSSNWRPKTTMKQIINRIQNLVIYDEINVYSPANMDVFKIFMENKEKYQSIMKEQAQKYKEKNIKYYEESCVHVEVENIQGK